MSCGAGLPAARNRFWMTPRLDKQQPGVLGNIHVEQTMSISRNFRLGASSATAIMMLAGAPVLAQQQKPNVVFILADNIGYGDLGPYGGGELRGARTPHIDQLAREGLRLT